MALTLDYKFAANKSLAEAPEFLSRSPTRLATGHTSTYLASCRSPQEKESGNGLYKES